LSSALLAFMLGVALGNVVRRVPLGRDGYFRAPLFALLNWYGLLIAERAQRVPRRVWRVNLVLVAGLAYPTYSVRNEMFTNFGDHPWRLIFRVVALGSLGAQFAYQRAGRWGARFFASSAFIVGLLTTMASKGRR
jgi:cytochrome bd-type quinol oxidase subunit 2